VTDALGKPLSLGLLGHQIPDRIPGNSILPNPVPAIGSASFSSPILPTSGRAFTGLKSLTNDQPENPQSKSEQGKNNLKLLSNPDTATLPLKISLNSDYMVTEYLKRGAHGAVYEGFKIKDGIVDDSKPLIFKVFSGGSYHHIPIDAYRNEVQALSILSRLEECDEEQLIVIMDKLPGESLSMKLDGLFKNGPENLSEEDDKLIYLLLEKYLNLSSDFIERYNLVHHDIRLDNVIVDDNGELHLIDFASTLPLSKDIRIAKYQRFLDYSKALKDLGIDQSGNLLPF
jgi:hypothetical protein